MDHTSILQKTLIDYTDWLLRQPGSDIGSGIHGSPSDLRGIFYNKLVANLRETYSIYDLRKAIHSDDIIITFRPPGFIATLKFDTSARISAPVCRFEILYSLNSALRGIDVLDYHTKLSYRLSKIISELKKL